jgi:hypothetical protein
MDDRCDSMDAADSIQYFYDMGKEQRDECGFKGHEWVCSDEAMMSTRHMSQLFIDHMNTAFEKWTPREKYEVIKV